MQANPQQLEKTLSGDNPLPNGTQQEGGSLSGLVSDEDVSNLFLFWTSVRVFIVCPGMWANVINMRTFLRMGLNDNVTISFFALACADFCTLTVGATTLVLNVMIYMSNTGIWFFTLHPRVMSTYLTSIGSLFNTVALFITLIMAVQRCLCIIRPLQFRDTFSRSLTWKILASITVITVTGTLAYMVCWRTRTVFNPVTNRSLTIIVINQKYYTQVVRPYLMLIFFLLFPVFSEAVICGSVIVMANKLKASVKFRKGVTGPNDSSQNITDSFGMQQKPAKDCTREDKVPSKERNAITQVTLICVIFLCVNIPKLLIAILDRVLPGYRYGGRYHNFTLVLANARATFDYVNSAVNFLVYYNYNSKFRNLCFGDLKKK